MDVALDLALGFGPGLRDEPLERGEPGSHDLFPSQEGHGILEKPTRPVVLLGLLDQPDQQALSLLFATLAPPEMMSNQFAMVAPGVAFARIDLELIERDVQLIRQVRRDRGRAGSGFLEARLSSEPTQPAKLMGKTQLVVRSSRLAGEALVLSSDDEVAPEDRFVRVARNGRKRLSFGVGENLEGHGSLYGPSACRLVQNVK